MEERLMRRHPEVLIVGAGPAGIAAALKLARAGVRVLVLEGAEFAGAENWSGGVLHAEGLAELLGPELWDDAPKERRVVARTLFLHDGLHAAGFEARASDGNDYGEAWTVLRPKFDRWLAARAIDAGATLLSATSVTGLRYRDQRVVGVDTDRGPVEADVVFLADGDAAGLIAREGLERVSAPHYAQGIKAVFRLDPREIERRFEVGPGEGVAQEWLLRDGKLAGRPVPLHITAFLYTNRESLSVGAVFPLPALAQSAVADHPHLMQRVLATPGLAAYLRDAEQVAYGAKVIRSGGVSETPEWVRDGLVVGGGGLGLGLEIPYPNFMGPAITSALAFADAVLALRERGDYSRVSLEREYIRPLRATDDYANAELIKHWPGAIHGGPMLFEHLPALFGQLVDADELPVLQARGQRRRALAMQVARLRRDIGQGLRMLRGMGPKLLTAAPRVPPLRVRFLVAHMGEAPNEPPGLNEPLLGMLAEAIGHFYGRRLPRFAQRLKFAWRTIRHAPAAMPRIAGLTGSALAGGLAWLGDLASYKWKRMPLNELLLRPYHRHEDASQREIDWAHARASAATPTGWIAPLVRVRPDARHLTVPLAVGAQGARALRNVCPAEVYLVTSRLGGVASQFENCIKCESCRVSVPAIDWNRLGRHRFAYRTPGDGRRGYDASVTSPLELPDPDAPQLGERERQSWTALHHNLRERPAIVGDEWKTRFVEALAIVPLSDATQALPGRLQAWAEQGKYGWAESELRALLDAALVPWRMPVGARAPVSHARHRRERRRQALRTAFPASRLRALAQEAWSATDRSEWLQWLASERDTRDEFIESTAAWSPALAWLATNHYLAENHAGAALTEDLAAPLWREADGSSNWLPAVATVLVDAQGRRHAPAAIHAHGMGADGAQPVRREVPEGLSGFRATPAMAAMSLALELGQARVLRDRAREYAATRVQFRGELKDAEGRETIGKFGAVKQMLAAIERGVQVMERARQHIADKPHAVLALARRHMGPWMDAIPWMAGQIFGGMAFSEEEIFAPRYRDAALFSQWPAAGELTTEDPEFEREVLIGVEQGQPVVGRALLGATEWTDAYARLPPPEAPPARHRTRGRKPLVWQTAKFRYRSGGFLNGEQLAPDQVLTPEHYRRDPILRDTRSDVLRLLRSGFESPDKTLSYGRYIDALHGMPEEDIDRLRAFNAFATIVPDMLGGKGWNKAQYSVLSTLTMGRKDTSVGLLVMASTSIGTMPVILGLEKDLPKLEEELRACLGDAAAWARVRADLDRLIAMLAHPEPKAFRQAMEAWGRHMQAMFVFPGSALKYLARNYLLRMQHAVATARSRDLDTLGGELESLRRELDVLHRELEDELAGLDARRQAHERFLRFLGSGQISAFALTEPAAGSDTGGIQTRAVRREVPAEPLGNGFYRFVPHGGGEPRMLCEGTRFDFENRRPHYRLDDGTLGVLDDSAWNGTTQQGERRIRADNDTYGFHDIGSVIEKDGRHVYRYWELTGSKMWITNGSVADRFSLYSQSDDGETGFMLERRSEGLRIGPNENKLGQRASPTNELTLDRVRVSAEQVIGYRGHGQVNALETLSVGRGGLVMGCATLGERLLHDYTAEWRREPQLHAQAQAEYDRIETLAARLMGLMDRVDLRTGDFRIEAALSKYLASEGLHRILMWFEKLHGPNAAAREEPIEKWRRDVRILNIYEGTNEVQRFLALKDLPALLKDGPAQKVDDPALDAALQAFRNFAGPRLQELGAAVWQDPDQQLRWFPVVEWAAQLYVWCSLVERLRMLVALDDPVDKEHVARLREHVAAQEQHVLAVARRVHEDFAQLDTRGDHPADASLLLARDLLNRVDAKDEQPVSVGALNGEWAVVVRSEYEFRDGTLRWAGWHPADIAVLDRLLDWADHSPDLRPRVAVCAPAGLEDRVQRLRAAGADVWRVIEPRGGFADATPVAAALRARWPGTKRLACGCRANHARDSAFVAQLAALAGGEVFADVAALGSVIRGDWIETADGVRRFLSARRSVTCSWDIKPTGRSDAFSVSAWLRALGSQVPGEMPAAEAARHPRHVPRVADVDVPEQFATPGELATWLGARFGAHGEAESTAKVVEAAGTRLSASRIWLSPAVALARAGSQAALRLIADLGGDFAVLALGSAEARPSVSLRQPGLQGVWQLPVDPAGGNAALARALAPHVRHGTCLVLDAASVSLAACLAAELQWPLLSNVSALQERIATCAHGDYLVDFDLPTHAVLVVADGYRARELARPDDGPLPLSWLPATTARPAGALARWQRRASAKPGGLASARLIVDIGLGIGNEAIYRNLVPPLVDVLARASGDPVEVGATRKITQELKLLPLDRQIGQTGIAVAPELVLALGISGAPQHMSWLGQRALVVAINRDPQAPIFSWHRQNPGPRVIACIGDLQEWVPELVRCLSAGDSAQSS